MANRKKAVTTARASNRSQDLSNGAIVVLSGGAFDLMNPPEVRARMDQLIVDINNDSFVSANTNGKGLTFKLLPDQENNHINQSDWPRVCVSLKELKPSPLILVGHSNGGAAVIDLARCLQEEAIFVDFAFTADSVLTLADNGDPNQVPSNVKLNLNSHVIPVFPIWLVLPFPFGTKNQREADNSLDGILNIGLPFPEPGAIAHRDAFYDLAGGDIQVDGSYTYPELIRDAALAVLRGASNEEIFQLAQSFLQTLANEARIAVELDKTTLNPAGVDPSIMTSRLSPSNVESWRKTFEALEKLRLSESGDSAPRKADRSYTSSQ